MANIRHSRVFDLTPLAMNNSPGRAVLSLLALAFIALGCYASVAFLESLDRSIVFKGDAGPALLADQVDLLADVFDIGVSSCNIATQGKTDIC